MKKIIFLIILICTFCSCNVVNHMAIRLDNDYVVTEKQLPYGYTYYSFPICDLTCEPTYYIQINNEWYITTRDILNKYKVGDAVKNTDYKVFNEKRKN